MPPGRLVVAAAVVVAVTAAPSASAEPVANCTSDVIDGVEVDTCVGNPNANTVTDVPGVNVDFDSPLASGSGGSSAPNRAQACSCPPVDRIENTQRLLEWFGSDAQLVPEGMIEPEDDEQQQTEKDGNRAQQA
jgi:hypothetical protein